MKIWDTESWEELMTLPAQRTLVYCVAWHPDGDRLLTASADSVRIWSAPGHGRAGGEE